MKKFDTYILDKSLERKRKKSEEERAYLLREVTETLNGLRGKYGIEEAYILGSLIQPKRWYSFSDIDIAVSGCSSSILEIMRDLETVSQREVDVIDLDSHPYPEMVRRRGERLYG